MKVSKKSKDNTNSNFDQFSKFIESNFAHLDKIKVKGEKYNDKGFHHKLGLHKRSITPTTLELIDFEQSDNDLYYKEYYNDVGNKVTRFAINESLLPSDKFSGSNKLDSWKSSKKSEAIKTNADRIKLDQIEVKLLTQAVLSMIENKVDTVVVDIFARDQGKIKFKNDFVETHTIVLHKFFGSDKEISVIDPSNFQFSCHLANINDSLEKDYGVKLVTKYTMDKIYIAPSEDDKVSFLPFHYRDCTDIAIKLALGLNNNKMKVNLSDMLELSITREVTNNPEIDTNIINLDDAPVRIKQATQSLIRQKFYSLTDKIQKLFKHHLVINNDEKGDSYRYHEEKYQTLLKSEFVPDQYQKCIFLLKEEHDTFYKEINSLMGEQHEHLDI